MSFPVLILTDSRNPPSRLLLLLPSRQQSVQVVGFDPGLTVQAALKLPRETKLLASVKAVLDTSDYVSLNIPFINKPVSEGVGVTVGMLQDRLLFSFL